MQFEFDPAKDAINQEKHGLSLAFAAELDWDASLVWVDDRHEYGELRMIALAPDIAGALAPVYQFLLNKWYFDELYNAVFVIPARWLGSFLWKKGDGALIDGLGPDNIAARAQDMAGVLSRFQSGYLYHYAFAMLIGIAALVTWMMLGSSL